MHAGAASSPGPHTRVARRVRQRRRVYHSGKETAANRGGSGWWPVCSARDLPRPAPRQRPGPAYGLVLLGDPPSFDEDDSDPHGCVKPLDAVALPSRAATAACRTRHGPTASCSAPMASRLRCLVTVYGPGCLPGHRDCLKRHDSLGFDAGRLLCPVVPREPSERLARPPSAVSDVHAARDKVCTPLRGFGRGLASSRVRAGAATVVYFDQGVRPAGFVIRTPAPFGTFLQKYSGPNGPCPSAIRTSLTNNCNREQPWRCCRWPALASRTNASFGSVP